MPQLPASLGALPWQVQLTTGWQYLLPPLAHRKLLCLSASPHFAANLSPLVGELTLLHDHRIQGLPGPGEGPEPATGKRRWLCLDASHGRNDPGAHRQNFDGVLIHDPEGQVVHRGNLAGLLALLERLPGLLRPGGFIYLGVRNAWAFPLSIQGPGGLGKRHRPLSIARLRRALRGPGLGEARISPYLGSAGRLNEVVCAGGYHASKNSERLAERAKEVVYGRLGARAFASAYGLLCFAGPAQASTLDLLADAIARAPYWLGAARPVCKSYLLFRGTKAIVTFGSAGDDGGDIVAVLTHDRLSVERRQAEVAALARLSQLPPPLARLIPRVLDQFGIGGTQCFLLSRMPGVTVDIEAPVLDEVSERALEFVIELHRASSSLTRIDEVQFQALFGSLVDAAIARNPWLEADLRAWDEPLRANVLGATLPTVWMHGDYKVENIMYDPRTRRLTGVIDWELARLPGLPLLDPLYLLIYNRSIRGDGWFEAMRTVLLATQRSDAEQASLRRYMDALGVPESLQTALAAMYLAHAIGCRLHLRDTLEDRQQVSLVVREVGEWLSSRAGRSAGA